MPLHFKLSNQFFHNTICVLVDYKIEKLVKIKLFDTSKLWYNKVVEDFKPKIQNITESLAFLSVIAIAFDLFRLDLWGTSDLTYLVWNLFLAWIPYILSLYFIKKDTSIKRFIPVFILWLLFFPNAAYLVTDVVHIASRLSPFLWYDSLLFFFFGWIGLLLGILSLFHVHQYIKSYLNFWISEAIILAICFVSSFGIYLGRFERWNSWDLFINPLQLIKHSLNISSGFTQTGTPFLFMVVFTIFLYLMYKTIYILIKH